MTWHLRAVLIWDGDSAADLWVDRDGRLTSTPDATAEELPGSYVIHGLVDSHAHPSVGEGPTGPLPLDGPGTLATLADWSRAGITVVRDVGSPGGLTLTLDTPPNSPRMQAAGRFFAPENHYFPELLPAAASEEDLTRLALAEIGRGASWIKVIADFPFVTDGEPSGPPQRTYSIEAIGSLVEAAHAAGVRVAVHSTIDNARELVEAGVDSLEHGTGLDEDTVRLMARTGTAWTPTLGAVLHAPDEQLPPARRVQRAEFQERVRELLPLAVALGVPVLTGSDGVGTVPGEVALLAAHGLTPSEALAAATTTAYRFLGVSFDGRGAPTSLVTYPTDPRDDPGILTSPSAVLIDGVRVL
jgi:imidazolonepropionase-like amidohydrolase